VVLDASDEQLPAGANLFLNLSRKAVRGRVGEHEVALASGQRRLISGITKLNERGYFEVYWEQPDPTSSTQWRRAAWTQWRYDTGVRRLCLFYDDLRGKQERLSVKTFSEYLTDGVGPEAPVDENLRPKDRDSEPPS
jgi:hypothetical protein